MTHTKAFIYTIVVFTLICLASYIAFGQPRQLSLQEALALTLANNRSIKVASLDVDKAQQEIVVAKSKTLPSIGISGQIDHYFRAPAFFGFGTNGNNEDKIPYGRFGGKDQATASLSFSQPLYDASIKPGLQYANLLQRTTSLSATDKKTNIAAAVKQTYIFILVLQERIKLQKESLIRNEKALKDAKSLLAQGRALRVDTLRAYTSVKNLEPDLFKLTYAIEVSKQQLKTLAGIDSLQDIELSDSLELPTSSSVLSEEEVYNEAKLNRADLKALDLQQQLADQQIKLAGAPMKPAVSLNAQYLLQTQVNNFNYLKSFYPSTPFVGAQVTVPIFSGHRNKAKVKQAKIKKDQSVIRSANAYEELKAEVKQVVADVHETTARIQTSANVKETAKLSYDITQYRYEKGVASRLELTDAELALTTAQSNYLEAVYDYLSSHIALERTMGRIEK
ncbi:MAG TPA: TolC family protein [Chitinophagaceae bacterium]|nr:TolC family protein [Chitinophagaceae bacterium]